MKPALAVMVLVTGCLSVPPYEPKPLVSYTEDNTGTTVAGTGAGFALHFAGGDGFHLPDTLMIDGTDVMGHDSTVSCSGQDEAGLQISPAPRISAHGGAMIGENRLVPVLRGPAIVQVKHEWTTRFAPSCTTRTPGGTSTFTVFPDGRIVRHDTISDPDSSPLPSTMCACGSDTRFNLATYWTLAKAPFQFLYSPNMNQPEMIPGLVEITNFDKACLAGSAYQVAFAWHDPEDTPDDAMNQHASDTVVHFGNASIQLGRNGRSSQLSLDETSAMFIGHDCVLQIERAQKYITPASLMINKSATTPARDNGIYGGDNGSDGQPGFALSGSDRAELIGPLGSPFAVWLRFPHAVDTIRATHPGSKGAWYVPQRVDDRSWIVWFPDPLMDTQPIVIEPN